VLSGDDSLALPMIAVGASGVISVASDVMPREVSDFVRTALAGDFAAARALHERYYDLFHDLFIDTNPIMVKEALVMTGRIGPGFRLPLCETTPEKREKLRATLAALGLQV
jgi:4-hydroxy-tetrahydrodipicolinate synthase